MRKGIAYNRIGSISCMLPARHYLTGSLILILIIFFSFKASGQENPVYDEISVFLEMPGVGGFDIPAVIKGTDLYLPVPDLFDFLKIRNIPSAGLDSISGFFINPEAKFLINYSTNRIRYQDRIYTISTGDLIRTESDLYMKSSLFGRVFGLECEFNFRNLSVKINSKLELPLIREMRLEEMRRNLTRLKGEVKADTTIGRTYPWFRMGMADWSAIGTEAVDGLSEARLNLNLGAMVAKGEATASLYYNSLEPFTEKQQYYQWRYVDNDFAPLRQVMVGKIATNSVSSIYNPVIGVDFTNTPTTYRRSFGTYKLSDKTDPGWIVELYVNNVLVDYVKADASGFYSFDVPLVYGNSMVKLKFYGPWGEEKSREQNINIPYNFLPANTFEYNVSAGFVEDSSFSRFSRASVSYGATGSLTIGGGAEYLSSVKSQPAMPFITSSLRITNNILLSADYTYDVRARGIFTWRLPSNLQLDLNYTWYDPNQTAISYNYREERKAALSVPLKIGNFYSYQRFTVYQVVLPLSNYTTAEWLFSGSIFGVNTNLTTYAMITGNENASVYSNLALAFRLPARLTLMPQIQYSYSYNKVLSAKVRVEKFLGKNAFAYLQYEQVFSNDLKMAEIGFTYNFSFAQTGLTYRQTNSTPTFIQYARGSLISDPQTHYFGADEHPNVGKGGITVIAFIDLNNNGKWDSGEPRAAGLNLHANGGRVIKNDSDTTIRITGLEPYTSCFIELDPASFENVAWRLPFKTMNVMVDPEILKTVEVPVTIAGEASGIVSMAGEGGKQGVGRIIVGFYNEMHKPVARTVSEDDGYYTYFGLAPGRYMVKVDTGQLKRLGLFAAPDTIGFRIRAGMEGDVVSGLEFILRKITKDTTRTITEKPPVQEPVKQVVRRDTVYMKIHEVTEQTITIGEDSYAVQLGAFRKRSNAEAFRKRLETILGKKVEIVVEKDLFKVRVTGLKDRKEVDETLEKLRKSGVSEVWIIFIKANQQERILIDKVDSVRRIKETIIEQPVTEVTPEMAIQAGAFRREEFAVTLRQKLASATGKPVIIIHEDGYYKVRITGFRNLQEIDKMMPLLGMLGLKDLWVPVVKKPIVTKPEVNKPDTTHRKIEVPVRPVQNPSDTTAKVKPETKTETVVKEPPFSLHVGEFRKHAQALRAQKKVSLKLHLPVEIYMRWDSYHLVITGFNSREETFPYYPELAGMGYTNIYVIEKK
jgi:cell division protein FtsN